MCNDPPLIVRKIVSTRVTLFRCSSVGSNNWSLAARRSLKKEQKCRAPLQKGWFKSPHPYCFKACLTWKQNVCLRPTNDTVIVGLGEITPKYEQNNIIYIIQYRFIYIYTHKYEPSGFRNCVGKYLIIK